MMVAGGPSVVQAGEYLMPGWYVQSWGSTEMMLPHTLLLGETGHGKEMEETILKRVYVQNGFIMRLVSAHFPLY